MADLINASKPTRCNVLTDIIPYLKETREAVNSIYSMLSPECGTVNLLAGSNILDVNGIGLIRLVPPVIGSASIINLQNAEPGQIVTLLVTAQASSMLMPITVTHDPVAINLQADRDYEMWEDSYVSLKFCGPGSWECQDSEATSWDEVGRSQVRYPPALNQPYLLNVDKYGAVVVEEV